MYAGFVKCRPMCELQWLLENKCGFIIIIKLLLSFSTMPQICARIMDRAERNRSSRSAKASLHAQEDSELLTELGKLYLMRGPTHFTNAMKCFKDAAKRDPNTLQPVMGMIHCQLSEVRGCLNDVTVRN